MAELNKEADDYAALIVAPDDAISARAVSQQKNRSHFARFSEALEEIDDLILPLRRTVAGAELVENTRMPPASMTVVMARRKRSPMRQPRRSHHPHQRLNPSLLHQRLAPLRAGRLKERLLREPCPEEVFFWQK